MTSGDLHTMYSYLSPEERFRLILAASSRGDFAETDRLSAAGKRIEFRVPDHAPWALAFTELAMIAFMELVELASKHREALRDWLDVSRSLEQKKPSGRRATTSKPKGLPDHDELSEDKKCELKLLGASFGMGYVLKSKIDGWKLFCEQMNVPAFSLWELLPGYERLAKAMDEVDETKTEFPAAFGAEHMLAFLRNHRPEGLPEPTKDRLISAEACANELRQLFRDGVKRHGG